VTEHRTRFLVSGVCCSTEESVLRKRLDASLGLEGYEFNLLTLELRVDSTVGEQRVLNEIRRAGFDARPMNRAVTEGSLLTRHQDGIITGVAAALTATGLLLQWLGNDTTAWRALLLLAIALGGRKIFLKAWAAVRTRALDMNVLMTVAVLGALAIDRWGEGAAVIVLFSFALMLETYSTSRTRKAVRSLLALSPAQCSVLRDGREVTLPAASVAQNEILLIRPGDRIPLDGVVVEGSSAVNQAAISGESDPAPKDPGSIVYAGSLNGFGQLRIRVTKRFEDTALAQIVHLIEESQQQRAPVQSLVDRFARVYTPAVLAIAALVAVLPPLLFGEPFQAWFYRSLVLLVIACPCALVISTPVTLVSALTNAARRGILVKGGKHIESLNVTHTMAMDKTGTLTEGRPRVTDMIPLDSLPRDQVLKVVAAMEYRSEHHLASAVMAEAAKAGIDYTHLPVENFEALPGRGIRASVDGVTYYLGNRRLCLDNGFWSPEIEKLQDRLVGEGKTAIVLGREGEALAILAVRDTARSHSREAITALRASGIHHLVMLSGDHESAAQQVAEELGIEHANAGLLPEQKVLAIKELQERYGNVAMVGDGINDAPALAAASTGIAMGIAGADASLETADVVLMSDDLGRLPHLFLLSRKAMTIVRQNIALALGLKLVFLALSIAGMSTLWMALLADDGAALAVIVNGLRLLSFKDSR
jgi:Zn2+/Cd2+-exporting ATPase